MGKIVAFLPARGGSKSIPLKNIKLFNGKPLIFWNIFALQRVEVVDEIVIATDSDAIEKTVLDFGFDKVKIYKRSVENASDTSSTESVMLEYINAVNIPMNSIFMLVQITSPLTQTEHFSEALQAYSLNKYDSMLTCVRNFRFYWNENGTSKNYDYRNRPRRQEFKGELMENGAFYINTAANIIRDKNRLSGKIGIYEMPSYTSIELDEPEDWQILENIAKKVNSIYFRKGQTKIVFTDVDGVLTDAGMYYSEHGDELKKFNTRDGMGFQLLRESGILTGILTSENTKIVQKRAEKLKVDFLFQGLNREGKLLAIKEICGSRNIALDDVAYIGDDLNCYDALTNVGFAACPQNADIRIKQIPGITILENKGGEGVFREFVDICILK
jgi:N-acylneuraminate cytidylyltransferase